MSEAIREKNLLLLARELCLNYYNVSLLDEHVNGHVVFGDIFKEDFYHAPSRNILIVGAGASHNSIDIFNVADNIIKSLFFEKLKVHKTLTASKEVWERFLDEAGKISNHKYPKDPKLAKEVTEQILHNLGFEQKFELLSHFIRNEMLTAKLKECLISRPIAQRQLKITDTFPSYLYEIVAHLFKHRFLDAVINMNFDEMLDNAIEDEMGCSTYYKIVHDSDVRPLKEIVDESRLRIPIYIKPHGTVRSQTSMKFTNNGYLAHPSGLNYLLSDLFAGSLKTHGHNEVEYLNIIFIGYSFQDIDIQNTIFEELAKRYKNDKASLKKVNIFIFARKEESNLKNFETSLGTWINKTYRPGKNDGDKQFDHQFAEFYKDLKDKIKDRIRFIKCDNTSTKHQEEYADENSFGYSLNRVYDLIRSQFNNADPFVPVALTRLKLLTSVFSRNYIKSEFENIISEPQAFYRNLAIINCLYSFIKYQGRVPLNEIIGGRAGKYNLLYFAEIRNNKHSKYGHLIDDLTSIFEKNRGWKVEVSDQLFFCKQFYNSRESDLSRGNLLRVVVEEILRMRNGDPHQISKARKTPEIEHIIALLRSQFVGRNSKEIHAIYNDTNHGRFYPFPQSNIINTNLQMTWKFFHLSVVRDWDVLCMIDDTGKPIFNLHSYCSIKTDESTQDGNDNCYLHQIRKNHIILLHSISDPHAINRRTKSDVPIPILPLIKNKMAPGHFKNYDLKGDKSNHKMALFFKNKKPVFGIYFFKPSTKSTINPVCFDLLKGNKEYARKNLELMHQFFINSAPDKCKEHLSKELGLPILS